MSDSAHLLPDSLVARARAAAAGGHTPVQPRAAATVVLLRDRADGPGVEAYLLRRVPSMAFAAGMHVFPGGSVDGRDADAAVAWAGPAARDWAGVLSADAPLARALVCAAVRETFEESGVLLAGPSPDTVVADPTGAGWEADRAALVDHSHAFADFLARRGLVLRADLVRPWAHWITPECEERRYDTRFFVAALPTGQRTHDVGGEADRVAWVRPEDALARHRAGAMPMLPPTVVTLAELAAFERVRDVLTAATARDVRPVLPKIVVTGDEVRMLLPGDADYPAT
ncbi:MAG TPA: NUDIX hydrolase [Mycobacteriales bacterium]|nr:NUDIX hydrolase [Mycobacteriales bacterium]